MPAGAELCEVIEFHLEFDKLHGAGNDFICLIASPGAGSVALARRLCRRHTGVGADGLLLLDTSDTADFRLTIYNADGSRAAMCGNGIRCAVRCAVDRGLTPRQDRVAVETDAGLRTVVPHYENGVVTAATADMGAPTVRWLERPVEAAGETALLSAVSTGNPHAVLFSVDDGLLRRLGPALQKHPLFPGGVNVELVRALGPHRLRVLVWERGAGEPLACGTGACAAVIAAVEKGLCPAGTDVTVKLLGGDLTVNYTPERLVLTGSAAEVFEGQFEY